MALIYALKLPIPLCGIFLYIPLIYLILKYRKKYSQSFYTLVLFVSINDLYCLCRFTYEGICSLFDYCSDGTVSFISILLAAFSYYMCMLLNLIIAWNRFSAVYLFLYYEKKIFTTKMIIVYYVSALLISGCIDYLMFFVG